MAQPQSQPSAGASAVASCAATDCHHNENQSCTADGIQVVMQGNKPTCGTYTREKPKARP